LARLNLPHVAALFMPGLASESTDAGPPAKISQLVNPYYVAADPIKGLIQTIDQSTFSNMPEQDLVGWGSGKETMLGSRPGHYHMDGTMSAALTPPFGVALVLNATAGTGTTRRIVTSTVTSTGPYFNASDNFTYYDSGGKVVSDAPMSAGHHILMVLVDGTNASAWIDGVAQTPKALGSPANLGPGLQILANASGVGSFYDSLIQSILLYDGDWTVDGTRASIEASLDALAGGGIL